MIVRWANYSSICSYSTMIRRISCGSQRCEQFCRRAWRSWNAERTSSLELCFGWVKLHDYCHGSNVMRFYCCYAEEIKTLTRCIPQLEYEQLVVVAVPESVRMVSIHTLTSTIWSCAYVTDTFITRETRAEMIRSIYLGKKKINYIHNRIVT